MNTKKIKNISFISMILGMILAAYAVHSMSQHGGSMIISETKDFLLGIGVTSVALSVLLLLEKNKSFVMKFTNFMFGILGLYIIIARFWFL